MTPQRAFVASAGSRAAWGAHLSNSQGPDDLRVVVCQRDAEALAHSAANPVGTTEAVPRDTAWLR